MVELTFDRLFTALRPLAAVSIYLSELLSVGLVDSKPATICTDRMGTHLPADSAGRENVCFVNRNVQAVSQVNLSAQNHRVFGCLGKNRCQK
jgi:hypothetical protein